MNDSLIEYVGVWDQNLAIMHKYSKRYLIRCLGYVCAWNNIKRIGVSTAYRATKVPEM